MALECKADRIMLDNMSLIEMKKAVKMAWGKQNLRPVVIWLKIKF